VEERRVEKGEDRIVRSLTDVWRVSDDQNVQVLIFFGHTLLCYFSGSIFLGLLENLWHRSLFCMFFQQ
jgi:hypothetical protein